MLYNCISYYIYYIYIILYCILYKHLHSLTSLSWDTSSNGYDKINNKIIINNQDQDQVEHFPGSNSCPSSASLHCLFCFSRGATVWYNHHHRHHHHHCSHHRHYHHHHQHHRCHHHNYHSSYLSPPAVVYFFQVGILFPQRTRKRQLLTKFIFRIFQTHSFVFIFRTINVYRQKCPPKLCNFVVIWKFPWWWWWSPANSAAGIPFNYSTISWSWSIMIILCHIYHMSKYIFMMTIIMIFS